MGYYYYCRALAFVTSYDLPSLWLAFVPGYVDSPLLLQLVVEVVICVPQPIPYFGFNKFFGFGWTSVVWMCLRVYMLVRIFHDYLSPFRHEAKKDFQSRVHGKREVNFLRSIKLLLNRSVMLVIAVIIPVFVFGGGFTLHILERGWFPSQSIVNIAKPLCGCNLPPQTLPNMNDYYYSQFASYQSSCWFTIGTRQWGRRWPVP